MTNEQIQALKAAAENATALDLDSAKLQRGNDGYYECPVCCGAGEVEAKTDFCNIDGVALGVQFYGIGEHHCAAEAYFRAANPAVILSLLAERDADKALIAEQDARLIEYARIATENAARTLTVKLPTAYDLSGEVDGNCSLNDASMNPDANGCYFRRRDVEQACAAAGITLVVGE